MGMQNRQRRKAKERRRQQRRRMGGGHGQAAGWGLPPAAELAAVVLDTIRLAAHAGCEGGSREDQQRAAARLADGLGLPGGPAFIATGLADLLAGLAAGVLGSGWEPPEVCRVVRRKAGAAAVGAVASGLREAVRAAAPEVRARWLDPAGRLTAEAVAELVGGPRTLDPEGPSWPADVAAALEAVGVLEHLRPLPNLWSVADAAAATGRQPAGGGSAVDGRMLARVRALLAKAESSDFAEEAETFMAKAQELMTRYNLDRALVEEATAGPPRVAARRCWLEDPYLPAKGFLLAVVAEANRCRAVLDEAYGFVTLVGHPDDLESSELLFTSLLAQATRRLAGLAPTAQPEWPGGRARTRRPSFRRSFLVGFTSRIGARLREAAAASTAAADGETGGRLLPVLARRADHTEEATRRLFPHLVENSLTATDLAGWATGTAAADLAELVVQPELSDLAAG